MILAQESILCEQREMVNFSWLQKLGWNVLSETWVCGPELLCQVYKPSRDSGADTSTNNKNYGGYHQDPCNTGYLPESYSKGRFGKFEGSKFIPGTWKLTDSQKWHMGLIAHIPFFLEIILLYMIYILTKQTWKKRCICSLTVCLSCKIKKNIHLLLLQRFCNCILRFHDRKKPKKRESDKETLWISHRGAS